MKKTAAQRYKSGELTEDDIDLMVEKWHKGEECNSISLHEYIGFTQDEYAAWVMRRLPGPNSEAKKRVVARSRKARR